MKARYLWRAFKARYRDEKPEILAALSAIRAGDTAVDVGANKGAYLYWLRKAVGDSGQVFAYEPQPRLAGYLKSVGEALHWQNVSVREVALSDKAGVATLNVPGSGDSPSASLEASALAATAGQRYECKVDTLDNQLKDVARVAFLKVDVEGHELNLFRGATHTLTRCKPVVLFECERRHLTGHTMEEVFSMLAGLGYDGSFFSPTGLRPLREFDASVHQKQNGERFWDSSEYCNNFLFTSRRA